jgi:archaeal flagellar protein FlaI
LTSYVDELKKQIEEARSKALNESNNNSDKNRDNSSDNSNNNSNNDNNNDLDKDKNNSNLKNKEIDLNSEDIRSSDVKSNFNENKDTNKNESLNKDTDRLVTLKEGFNIKTNDNSYNNDVGNSTTNVTSDYNKINFNENKDVNINESLNKDSNENISSKLKDQLESSAVGKLSFEKIRKVEDKEKNSKDLEKNWLEKSHLVTKYGDVEIYRIDGEILLLYKVPTPKPSPSQKLIINTLKEAATRLITSDPYKIKDPLQRKNIYYQKIIEILENAPEINIPKHLFDFYASTVVKEMVGYGVIEPLLLDDKLEEIMIVGPNKPTYIYHVDFGMMTTNIIFYSDDQIYEIIDKISRTVGRRLDISNPLLDARLPDGSRVNATIAPASIDGSTLTIRKFKKDPYTIVDLINNSTLNYETAAFLWSIVEGFNGAKPANIIISGGTGSGKTTTLNVLANFISESDRILTIEDTAELKLPLKHLIRFEGRPPGLEGTGELTLDILVKNSLRMRPDRIIVGEIRHTEALSLFTAMNTGHDGCMGTIHANSARETLVRITAPPMDVPMLMLAGLDFIIVQKRLNTDKGSVRRIVSISEITGVLDNKPQANVIFRWDPKTDRLERTEHPIQYFEIIKDYSKLSDENIKNLIEKRIEVLEELVKNNERDIIEVSKKVQETYISQRNLKK